MSGGVGAAEQAQEPVRWYTVADTDALVSPALLVYPARMARNHAAMVAVVGGDVARLRPHAKTHKMAEVVQLQRDLGVTKFKCATLAEAELLGRGGAPDVLLAMQPVGPDVGRYLVLAQAYPATRFSTLVDDRAVAEALARAAAEAGTRVELFVDLDVGMHRTGCAPADARALYEALSQNPHLLARGLHAYDGHLHTPDLAARTAACDAAFADVAALRDELLDAGLAVPTVVAGGSPTFPIHARRTGVELSPGTAPLWDAGYADHFPDLPFVPAAALFTRVVSKPGPDLLCFDLGHKSVAAEMPLPRVRFLDLPGAEQVAQSEEHLVVRTPDAARVAVGDGRYAIPVHICPTVAKYPAALTVVDGRVAGAWRVVARDRRLTI